MPKRRALLRITQRMLERALRNPARLRRDSDSSAVQRRKRNLISFAFRADSVRGGHFTIRERKFHARRCVNSKFLFFFTNRKSRRLAFYRQRGDPFFSLGRFRAFVCSAAAFDPACGSVSA